MMEDAFHFRFAKRLAIVVGAVILVSIAYFTARKTASAGSHDLGRIPLAGEVIHEFVVVNPFPDRLILSGVRATHQDTAVVAYDPVIPARGRGVVRVRMTPTEIGPFQAHFIIDYAGKRHGLRQFAFHGEVVAPLLPARTSPPAPDLLISASELLALLSLPHSQAPVVVDLRGTDDYQRSHLPESLNMSSFQLKGSSYLKKRSLILVDEGQDSEATIQTVIQLQKTGFSSVRILEGGIPAWQALEAPLAGSERDRLVEISPTVFFQAGIRKGWRILDLRTQDRPLPIPAPSVRFPLVNLQSHDALQKLRMSFPESSKVLILTDQGAGRESLRALTDAMKGIPLYFIRGGGKAVDRELLQIARSKIEPVTTRINGTTTVSNRRVSRSIGGCLSCP